VRQAAHLESSSQSVLGPPREALKQKKQFRARPIQKKKPFIVLRSTKKLTMMEDKELHTEKRSRENSRSADKSGRRSADKAGRRSGDKSGRRSADKPGRTTATTKPN
jgi:hypothetical protein